MSALIFSEEISERLGGAVTATTVQRKMRRSEWPHTLVGRHRGMTEQQFQETLALLAVEATGAPVPNPSGLSPRSRLRRAG